MKLRLLFTIAIAHCGGAFGMEISSTATESDIKKGFIDFPPLNEKNWPYKSAKSVVGGLEALQQKTSPTEQLTRAEFLTDMAVLTSLLLTFRDDESKASPIKCAIKHLAVHCDNLYTTQASTEDIARFEEFAKTLFEEKNKLSASDTDPKEDFPYKGIVWASARSLEKSDLEKLITSKTTLFDLIGADCCKSYALSCAKNVNLDNLATLNFIQAFLTLKENSDPLMRELLQKAGIQDIRNGKRQAELIEAELAEAERLKEQAALRAAIKKQRQADSKEVVISVGPAIASKKENIFKPRVPRKTDDSETNPGFSGIYVIADDPEPEIATKEEKSVSVKIPESPQATLSKEIPASHPTQQKSRWKPAIVTTAVVAGIGAACWYQWNTVKAFAQKYVPESVAALLGKYHKNPA